MKFFSVPVLYPEEAEKELNEFLATHRVSNVIPQLVSSGSGAHWAVAVMWLAEVEEPKSRSRRREAVDYREVLPPEEFAVYAQLRELRKTIAQRENVPAYIVFTNAQLAAMVQGQVRTLEALAAIAGVGEARLEQHGKIFLELLRSLEPGEAAE
ncbi:MAG: HRDC domain-containing protein [Acidobacteriota bacterium]